MENKELTKEAVPLTENPIAKGFLYGQYANLFKFAVWWTTLAPLSYALMDKDAEAIGVARIVYNVALCVMSPLGGLMVERVHPRKILNTAAGARFFLWCILVPVSWLLFDSSVVTNCQTAMYVLFNVAMFFDGCVVALSAILDIDLAGLDVVSGRYGLDVTDDDRNYFNSRQELCFALCFIFLAPGTAFLGLAFKNAFEDGKDDVRLTEGGTLIAVFFVVFLIATILQFFFFRSLTDDTPAPEEAPLVVADAEAPVEEAPPTFWVQIKSVPSDLLGSLQVIWSSKPILFRLIFLGLEIAFEDAAIVVIAAQMGIFLPWLGDNDAVTGNIWTSLGVASGKLGGAIASLIMMKFFTPPEKPTKFVIVFILIFVSTLFVLVFPATVEAREGGHISDDSARALYLTAFFLYFFFSTLPKLGLMCLFQSMVSQVENGPRVFGFVAIIAMSFDAVVVMALSVLFNRMEFKNALWVTAFVYVGHGFLELIFGPLLVLIPMEKIAEAAAANEGPSDDNASMAAKNTSSSEAPAAPVVAVESPEEQVGSYRARMTRPSRLDAADSYYTQRSAAVPVSAPEDVPNTLTVGGDRAEVGSVYAVMSVSKNFAYGSMARRKSALGAQPREAEATVNTYGSVQSPPIRASPSRLENASFLGDGGQSSYVRKGSSLLPPSRLKHKSNLN